MGEDALGQAPGPDRLSGRLGGLLHPSLEYGAKAVRSSFRTLRPDSKASKVAVVNLGSAHETRAAASLIDLTVRAPGAPALLKLVAPPATRGDPKAPLRWTTHTRS
jgi:hypothetical protein